MFDCNQVKAEECVNTQEKLVSCEGECTEQSYRMLRKLPNSYANLINRLCECRMQGMPTAPATLSAVNPI